jgi:hypothetical protein
MENGTPAAKAERGGVIYGTAEAVPFLETQFSRRGSKAQVVFLLEDLREPQGALQISPLRSG